MGTNVNVADNAPNQILAISLSAESSFGDSYESTIGNMIAFPIQDNLIIRKTPNQRYSNEDAAKLGRMPTVDRIINEHIQNGGIPFELTPSMAGIVLGGMAQATATSNPEAGVTKHDFTYHQEKNNLNLESRTTTFKRFDVIKDYKGTVYPVYEFTADKANEQVKCSIALDGYNTVQASAFDDDALSSVLVEGVPSGSAQEIYFDWHEVTFDYGTYNFSTGAFSSDADKSDLMTKVSLRLEEVIAQPHKHKFGGAGLVDQYITSTYVMSLSASFLIQTDADWFIADHDAQTTRAFQVQCQSSDNIPTKSTPWEVNHIITKAKPTGLSYTQEDGIWVANVDFKVMGTPDTTGSLGDEFFKAEVTSLITDYTA